MSAACAESRLIGGLPAQRSFGLRVAPGLVRDAAEREAGVFDGSAVELKAGRDRNQRERIGEAIANLEIRVVRRETRGPAARSP